MTFLATDPATGELVPGSVVKAEHGWPEPWGFACDGCGRRLPYGIVLRPDEPRRSRDEARHVGGGDDGTAEKPAHLCGDCEGFTEGFTEQLAMGLS